MTRRSIRPGSAPGSRLPVELPAALAAAASAVPVASDAMGWRPTERQRRAKSRLLIERRYDLTLQPAQMSTSSLSLILGVQELTLSDWFKHPEFRAWLLSKRETEEQAQFLLDCFLDEVGIRLPDMTDKDLIQAGKLLNDICQKQAEAAAPADIDMSAKSPEELMKLIAKLAPQLLPPAHT